VKTFSLQFLHSGNEVEVSLQALRTATREFLSQWGTEFFLGREFCAHIAGSDPFAQLLQACNLDENIPRMWL